MSEGNTERKRLPFGVDEALALVGCLLIVAGISLWSRPAALVASGLMLVFASLCTSGLIGPVFLALVTAAKGLKKVAE